MNSIYTIKPTQCNETRVYRQISFRLETFDSFMAIKRLLCDYWGEAFTNAEIMDVIIQSHPTVNPELHVVEP